MLFSFRAGEKRKTNSEQVELTNFGNRSFSIESSLTAAGAHFVTMLHAAGGHARSLARVLVPRRLVLRYRRNWPSSTLASSSLSSSTSPTLQRLASVPSSSRRQYSVIAAAARGTQATAAATVDATRPAARELAPAAPPLADDAARGPRQPPPLMLYDSMARTKRAFEPRAGGEPVSMYVCGVTVYDFSHVGKLFRSGKEKTRRRETATDRHFFY